MTVGGGVLGARGGATAAVLLLIAAPLGAAERDLATDRQYPAMPGKRLVIDGGTLDILLRAADITDIEVSTRLRIAGVGERKAERWITDHTPAAADAEDELRVTVPAAGSGFLGLGYLTAHARLAALAPSTVVPDVTTTSGSIRLRGDFPLADPLLLRSAGGSITFEGAAASADIRSTGGDAELRVIRPLGRLFARTSSGGLTLAGGARQVEIDTASGDVLLADLSGAATVTTTTGRVTLSWDRLDPGQKVKVRSSSGRVELVLPPQVHPQGSLTTTTGIIRCELPGTLNDRGDTVTLAGDGPVLEIETASADIVLRARDEITD